MKQVVLLFCTFLILGLSPAREQVKPLTRDVVSVPKNLKAQKEKQKKKDVYGFIVYVGAKANIVDIGIRDERYADLMESMLHHNKDVEYMGELRKESYGVNESKDRSYKQWNAEVWEQGEAPQINKLWKTEGDKKIYVRPYSKITLTSIGIAFSNKNDKFLKNITFTQGNKKKLKPLNNIKSKKDCTEVDDKIFYCEWEFVR